MPAVVKLRDGKYRVIEDETGELVKNAAGTPVDGGGFDTKEAAERQARAINANKTRKGELSDDRINYAPILESGDSRGIPIKLREVTDRFGPIKIQENAVALSGGVVNRGSSENDIDVIMRIPDSEDLKRIISFRIARMFPVELRDRIQFVEDNAGPIGSFIPVFDIELAVNPRFPGITKMQEGEKPEHPDGERVGKVPKFIAKYVSESPWADRQCSNCGWFFSSENIGKCGIVSGNILPGAFCELFGTIGFAQNKEAESLVSGQ